MYIVIFRYVEPMLKEHFLQINKYQIIDRHKFIMRLFTNVLFYVLDKNLLLL
jgi:hypothetical protein